MINIRKGRLKNLGELEQAIMECVWSKGPSSAEACRETLARDRPLKDSTVRTVLRRLEQKGFLTHTMNGRTYIYRAAEPRQNIAARAVRQIIDRFCGGSAEELVIGLVDNQVLDRQQLERLARMVTEAAQSAKGKEGKS